MNKKGTWNGLGVKFYDHGKHGRRDGPLIPAKAGTQIVSLGALAEGRQEFDPRTTRTTRTGSVIGLESLGRFVWFVWFVDPIFLGAPE
jgi:hypothetical protein